MKVLEVENVSKQYRLGVVGTGTLSHDLNRWFHRLRGKEDPYKKIGEENDRSTKGDSRYVWALRDVNMEVNEGEVVGIIGKNGAGKSTLLKILSRVTMPSTGSIKAKGRISSLLEVGTGFHPELTGRENIFLNGAILGMRKTEIAHKLDEIIDFAGVERYIDTPVKRYSSGMYVRLAFAVAAHLEPEILIVDEVLAVGDAEFQKKCLGKMKEVSGQGRTVLFVSHNMGAVKQLCTRGIFMEYGQVKMKGTTTECINEYLRGGGDASNFGIIPTDYPRKNYHKGFARMNAIFCKNAAGELVQSIMYHQPLKLEINLDVMKDILDGILVVYVANSLTDKVIYSASNDRNNAAVLNLHEGKHRFDVSIDQNLLPGTYSINAAIMDNKGYPYEGILNFGSFTVENFGEDGLQYPWPRPLAQVNVPMQLEHTIL